MSLSARKIVRSCRISLWPFIILNTVAVGLSIGAPSSLAYTFGASLCLLSSFGFILNDLWDRDVDRVNMTGRFEELTKKELFFASCLAIAMLAGALAAAVTVANSAFVIALCIAIGVTLYSVIIRPVLFAANVLCASLATSPLWGPCVIWHDSITTFHCYTCALALLAIIAREIILDVKDRAGDHAAGRMTIATVFGAKVGVRTACLLLSSVVCVELFLAVSGSTQASILIRTGTASMVLLAGLAILYPAVRILVDGPESSNMQRFIVWSRYGMGAFSLAFFAYWIGIR